MATCARPPFAQPTDRSSGYWPGEIEAYQALLAKPYESLDRADGERLVGDGTMVVA